MTPPCCATVLPAEHVWTLIQLHGTLHQIVSVIRHLSSDSLRKLLKGGIICVLNTLS